MCVLHIGCCILNASIITVHGDKGFNKRFYTNFNGTTSNLYGMESH